MLKYAEDGDVVSFNKYTFTSTDLMNIIFPNTFEDYEIFSAWRVVRSNILLHHTDVYLRFPSYDREIDMRTITTNSIMKMRINKLWKYANTYHNDNYICTDMILRQVIDGEPHGTHLVYYNLLKCHLENNNHVYYVPPHRLILGNREDEDGRINKVFQIGSDKLSIFIPEVLHFQKCRMHKTKALSCGYIDEEADENTFEGHFNLIYRLELIQSIMGESEVHPLIQPRFHKYYTDIDIIIKILKDSNPNKEDRIKKLDYLISEKFIS